MTHTDVEAWVTAYERAWRAPGTDRLRELFSAGAAYRMSPYEEPAEGLGEIAALWERERKGPGEAFEMGYRVIAVDGDTAVVRVEVEYGEPAPNEYRDLWVIRFGPDGKCVEFEEWPFWPGQDFIAEGGEK